MVREFSYWIKMGPAGTGELKKMRRYLAIILVTLMMCSSCSLLVKDVACAEKPIPGYLNSMQTQTGIFFKPESTAIAFDIFYDRWTQRHGGHSEVLDVLLNVCVIWEPYPFLVPGIGVDEDGLPRRASGLTDKSGPNQRPCIIKVYIGDKTKDGGRSIGKTATFHELAHTILWIDHDDWTKEHNETISLIKLEVKEMGL